jgi:hypothetical protein
MASGTGNGPGPANLGLRPVLIGEVVMAFNQMAAAEVSDQPMLDVTEPGSEQGDGGAGREQRQSDRPEQKILFQKFFKAGQNRTYAAQVKETSGGQPFLVITDGRRDKEGELRKSYVYVFSENFAEFFRMLQETAQYIKAHPAPPQPERRGRFQKSEPQGPSRRETAGSAPARPNARPTQRR